MSIHSCAINGSNRLFRHGPTSLNYSNRNAICAFNSFYSGAPAGGNNVPTNFTKLSDLNRANFKTIFTANFEKGLDTIFDWSIAERTDSNVVFSPLGRNETVSINGATIGPAEPDTSILPIDVDIDNPSTGTVYSMVSSRLITVSPSGTTYIWFSGVLGHAGTTTNSQSFRLDYISGGSGSGSFEQVTQINWNIDSLGAGGLNPSGITIDFSKRQTMVFEFNHANSGAVRVGFVLSLDDEPRIYWAHIFDNNNNSVFASLPNLSLSVEDRATRNSGNIMEREVGVNFNNNENNRIKFVHSMDPSSEPTLTINYQLHTVTADSSAPDEKNLYKSFTAGLGSTYVPVGGNDIFLFSIRPALEISGVDQKAQYTIDKMTVTAQSGAGQAKALIRILWLPNQTSPVYNPVGYYSLMEICTTAPATDLSSAIEIGSIPVTANQTLILSKEELFNEYTGKFSVPTLLLFNIDLITDVILARDIPKGTLAFYADFMGPSGSLNVSVNVQGGER